MISLALTENIPRIHFNLHHLSYLLLVNIQRLIVNGAFNLPLLALVAYKEQIASTDA